MASSTYKDGIRYSGFSQSSLKPSTNLLNIGNGINEGYTELLAQRYFKLPEISTVAYQYEVLIAERLEQIIGKEKMESLYLNANLKGLIEELKQYAEEDEIMQFIANTDFLLYHMDDKKLQLIKKKLIDKSLKNVNKFLIKCYAEKIKKQSKSDNSNKNGIIEDIANYISSLPSDITMNKTKYEITTVQDINECLTKIFNSNTPFCVELEEKKK